MAACAINKAKLGLTFPALITGSLIPDLEPFIGFLSGGRLLPARGFLHSLLGTVTLDAFLTVIITTFVYPTLAVWVFRVERRKIAEKCRFSGMLVLSSFIGTLSHLLIDTTMHEYNPLLYPFTSQSIDNLVLLGHWLPASILVHTLLFVLLLAILVYELRKGEEGFWNRLLAE